MYELKRFSYFHILYVKKENLQSVTVSLKQSIRMRNETFSFTFLTRPIFSIWLFFLHGSIKMDVLTAKISILLFYQIQVKLNIHQQNQK